MRKIYAALLLSACVRPTYIQPARSEEIELPARFNGQQIVINCDLACTTERLLDKQLWRKRDWHAWLLSIVPYQKNEAQFGSLGFAIPFDAERFGAVVRTFDRYMDRYFWPWK